MRTFRKKLESIIVKTLLMLVAVSFVIWGINGGREIKGGDWIIKVENQELSYNDWQRLLNTAIEERKKYDPKFIYNPQTEKDAPLLQDIKLKVLRQSINEMVLVQEAKRLGILASDEQVKKELYKIDAFKNKRGQFSKSIFQKVMHNNALNESIFIDKLRDGIMRSRILEIFVPNKQFIATQMGNMFIRSIYAQRVVALYKISQQNVSIMLGAPIDSVLRKFMKKNSAIFVEPEVRDYSYFLLTADKLPKNKITISEEEIKEMYQNKKLFYIEKEKRDIKQIILKTEADAINLRRTIVSQKTNESFATIAQKFSISSARIALQNIEEKAFSRKSGKILFKLKEGEVSAPIRSKDGWHLFKIQKIYPQRIKSIDELRDELRAQIYNEKLFELLNQSIKAIEQDLNIQNSYENFATIAKKYNLEIKNIVNAEKALQNKQMNTMSNTEKNVDTQINAAAFQIEKNQISHIVAIENGEVFGALYVKKIRPERLPEFDTIKDKVIKAWSETQQDTILSEIAYKKLSILRSDKKENFHNKQEQGNKKTSSKTYIIRDIADIDIDKIKIMPTSVTIRKDEPAPKGAPYSLYTELLEADMGYSSNIYRCSEQERGCYIFGKINDIKYPEQKEIEQLRQRLTQEVGRLYSDIVVEEYLRAIRANYRIQVKYNLIGVKTP